MRLPVARTRWIIGGFAHHVCGVSVVDFGYGGVRTTQACSTRTDIRQSGATAHPTEVTIKCRASSAIL